MTSLFKVTESLWCSRGTTSSAGRWPRPHSPVRSTG